MGSLQEPVVGTVFEAGIDDDIGTVPLNHFDGIDEAFAGPEHHDVEPVDDRAAAAVHDAGVLDGDPFRWNDGSAVLPIRGESTVTAQVGLFETGSAAVTRLAPASACAVGDFIDHWIVGAGNTAFDGRDWTLEPDAFAGVAVERTIEGRHGESCAGSERGRAHSREIIADAAPEPPAGKVERLRGNVGDFDKWKLAAAGGRRVEDLGNDRGRDSG